MKGTPARGCNTYMSEGRHGAPGARATTPRRASCITSSIASNSARSAKRLGTGLPSTPRWGMAKLVAKPAAPAAIASANTRFMPSTSSGVAVRS